MADSEISAKINYGGLKNLIKEMSKNYSVKVGLLAENGGSDEVSENLDLAGLGAVQEFGATINHPGGQPYFINEFGMVTFLKKDSFYGQVQIRRGIVTKPHEITIPARSWLQMPLERNQDLRAKIKEKTDLTKQDRELLELTIQEYGEGGLLKDLAYAVGTSALEQIQEAFQTEGFGEWAENRPATIKAKGSESPLIDTGRLRNAITYKVEENNG